MKIARKWDNMSHDQQLVYLKKHKKSKQRPTSVTSEGLIELRKILGTYSFNKSVEGKQHKVKIEVENWVNKLTALDFQEVDSDDGRRFEKGNLAVNIKSGKGKMRYYATLDIESTMSKAAYFLQIQNEFIKYAIMNNKKKSLDDAIELLTNFEKAENPRSILQQAANIVSLHKVKPKDIELAADVYDSDPEQAKRFIFGPSGRGSGLGVIKDLQIIKEKQND